MVRGSNGGGRVRVGLVAFETVAVAEDVAVEECGSRCSSTGKVLRAVAATLLFSSKTLRNIIVLIAIMVLVDFGSCCDGHHHRHEKNEKRKRERFWAFENEPIDVTCHMTS